MAEIVEFKVDGNTVQTASGSKTHVRHEKLSRREAKASPVVEPVKGPAVKTPEVSKAEVKP